MAKNSVKEVFWTNVNWHRKNKNILWVDLVGEDKKRASLKNLSITHNTIESIAKALDIDDYAILFEEIERTEPNE